MTADKANRGFSATDLAQLHALVRGYVDREAIAGFVTLIARDGHLVDIHAYGFRDREEKLPMQPDTLFRIASMTKLVTAAAVLTLSDDKRIQLDDPVARYLPELKAMRVVVGEEQETLKTIWTRPITIRQLLTHTSGFSSNGPHSALLTPLYKDAFDDNRKSLDAVISAAAMLPLCNHPGTAMYYGLGYNILGRLIEVVSGQSFDRYIHQRITQPLGMNDTFFQIPKEKQSRLAKTYERTAGGVLTWQKWKSLPYFLGGTGYPRGSSGLISTADDFNRFAQMLLNKGQNEGIRILNAHTVREMMTDQLITVTEPNTFLQAYESYGLGVSVRLSTESGPPGSIGQVGWTGAYTTYVSLDQREGTIALLLAQHLPWNDQDIFTRFSTAFYAAMNRKFERT